MKINLKGISNFFEDVSNFVSRRGVLGIDIGTVAIKLVELFKKGENLVLENYGILGTRGYLERGNEAIQTSSLKIVERETIELLEILLREVQPKSKLAVASIPVFSAFITPLELPLLSQEETAQAVSFQARQYIPMAAEEVSVDWVRIEEFEDKKSQPKQRLLLIGIPNETIKKYKSIFKAVGLRLNALEVESFGLTRSLFKNEKAPSLVIDIGAESTNLNVVENSILKQSSQVDYGGSFLTYSLARGLEISPSRAEELKQRRGLVGSGGESELSTLLLPLLDVIINEAKRVQALYERNYGKRIELVTLVGGGANLPGIEEYVRGQTGLKVFKSYPFSGIEYKSELEPAIKDLSNVLGTAIGLAQRYFSEK